MRILTDMQTLVAAYVCLEEILINEIVEINIV